MEEEKKLLLAKVAYMYYEEGMSQAEISTALDIYRTTVSRMLTQAKKKGIVEIKINHFNSELFDLEMRMKQRFKLKRIEIVPTIQEDTESEKESKFASVAAGFIRKQITDGSVVGLSWGSTIAKAINQIHNKHTTNTFFLPVVGGPSHVNSQYHVNTLVYELARKFNGQSIFINATVIQESKSLANGILQSKYFEEIRDYWTRLDTVIVGIGGPLEYKKSQWRDLLTSKDLRDLKLREAVGDCCCCFYDGDGKILKGDLYHRRIGLSLEELVSIPCSIGIANDKEKAKSILAILKKGYINSLITDQETALEVLRLDELGK